MFLETRGKPQDSKLFLCTILFLTLKFIGLCVKPQPALDQFSANEKECHTIHKIADFLLSDITNKIGMFRKRFYDTVVSTDESSDKDH